MFTIHQRNIQSRAIELSRVKGNLSNNIMYNIFQTRKINYNLRSQNDLVFVNSLKYFPSKLWSMVPLEIKNSKHSKQKFEIGSLKIVTVTYVKPM